jgi:hypothetical protein
MARDMIVCARNDADASAVRGPGELLQARNDLLGLGHVQLAVRAHEVVLSVNVPEDEARHDRRSLSIHVRQSGIGASGYNRLTDG